MKNYRRLTVVSALFFVAFGIANPLLTLYLEGLGASLRQISWILTSVVATMLVMSYVWGRLSDRLGRRKPLLVFGLAGMCVAYLLLSRVATGNGAWVARVVEGVCMAAYSTLSLAIIGDSIEQSPRKGRAMGVYRGIGSLAFSAGAVSGGRLADLYSIQTALIVCAVCFATAAAVALTLEDVRPTPRPAVVRQAPGAPRRRALPYAFLGGVFCWLAAHSASTSMWPNYMASLGYTKTTIGDLWGFAALIEMPAMILSGILSDTLGRALLLTGGAFAIMTVQIGYLTLASWLPALFGIQIIRGFGFGSYTSTAMTFTAESGEQATRGRNSGLFNMTVGAGQLAGTFLGGQLAGQWGFATLYTLCALLALCSASCFLILRRTPRPVVAAAAG